MPAAPSLSSIERALGDVLGALPCRLDGMARLQDLPGWDDSRCAAVVKLCEQRFTIQLNRRQIGHMASVGDLLRICRQLRAERRAAAHAGMGRRPSG